MKNTFQVDDRVCLTCFVSGQMFYKTGTFLGYALNGGGGIVLLDEPTSTNKAEVAMIGFINHLVVT
jgi:hypothetical protein